MDIRSKDVINALKMENRRLKEENKELMKIARHVVDGLSQASSTEEIKEDVRVLKQEYMVKMEKSRRQFRIAVPVIIISWCVFSCVCLGTKE